MQGGGTLRRIPSTFPFFYQYFGYLLSMAAVSYAWGRACLPRTRLAPLGLSVWLLTILASFLSGSRASYIFVPFLLLAVLILERPGFRLPVGRLVPVMVILTSAAAILGGRIDRILAFGASVGTEAFGGLFLTAFRKALSLTAAGFGTGMDTNASRYAVPVSEQFRALDGFWYESWYVKALLELGLAGLVIVALLFVWIVCLALRQHHQLEDRGLRIVSASLIAFLVSVMLLSSKAQYLDLDPINVYFWLFIGVLVRISTLDRMPAKTDGASDAVGTSRD